MENLDFVQQARQKFAQRMLDATQKNDLKEVDLAFTEFADALQQQVMNEAKGLVQSVDTNILTARGARLLTSEERKYYDGLIQAMKSSNPKQALTELEVVMPKTTIDAVFEDLTENHPLLDAVNFQNTSGLIEYLVNTNGNQLATWNVLTSEIVTELTSGFKKVNMQLNKLSAFLPVAKDMLDLGPVWLDRYVRVVLAEALALGLEEAIINGTGKNQPIGMVRQVGDGVTVTDGVYPEKTPVAVTDLSPAAYGELIAGMAKAPNGKSRTVNEVIMLVNPVDYLKKIMPATTIRGSDGTYISNILPFPTRIIQSIQIKENRAVIGLAKRYFMGVGTAKSGKMEYSDEYKFLEDERVYMVKLYGHGEPLDNNAFVVADITGLKPAVQLVSVDGAVKTKEQA